MDWIAKTGKNFNKCLFRCMYFAKLKKYEFNLFHEFDGFN